MDTKQKVDVVTEKKIHLCHQLTLHKLTVCSLYLHPRLEFRVSSIPTIPKVYQIPSKIRLTMSVFY